MISPQTRALLDHHLAAAQAAQRLPSVAAGLVRDGALVWSGHVGALDGRAGGPTGSDDTQYRIGSITKTFVAASVLAARDAGLLDLDDPVAEHLPELSARATIGQLLCHGGGVQAETDGDWWERTPGIAWDELAAATGQRFRAGLRHHYSNVGYAWLGRVLEVVRGRPWFEVVRGDTLDPLGMTATTLRPRPGAAPGWAVHPFADVLLAEPEHDAGAMAPAGQLWSTVPDLARWAAALAGRASDVLPPERLAEMLVPHVVVDSPGQPWQAAWGPGLQLWNEDGRRIAGHGGSMPGFLAGLQVDLASGDGAVILANTTSARIGPVATGLLDLLAAHEPAPVPAWHAGGDAAALELTGPWWWGPAASPGSLRDGLLVLGEPGTGRGARFRPVGPDLWVGLDGYYAGEPLRVLRTPDGAVSHLDIASFRLTRTPYAPDADVPGGVAGWR